MGLTQLVLLITNYQINSVLNNGLLVPSPNAAHRLAIAAVCRHPHDGPRDHQTLLQGLFYA